MRHPQRLDPLAGDAQLLGLDQGGTRAAEWVEHKVGWPKAESLRIGADQVRWIRKDEPVPVVRGGVFGPEPVYCSIGSPWRHGTLALE